ncbi:MAG TPA: glycosyltransferase family 9 protein [Ktedonosporobacter sp.]|nr:glycosyltransferase family 9 protein [Ktedonosporobacter sp.]
MTTRTSEMSFLQELALNKQLVIAKQDQETLACVSKIFKAANGILIRLGGKAGRLGESIVGTAFLEGILLALDCLHINDVDISIVVDENVVELFDEELYQARFSRQINVFQAPSDATNNIWKLPAYHPGQDNIMIMDFHGANDGAPYLQVDQEMLTHSNEPSSRMRTVTTLSHLFRVAVRSYVHRGPYRRYADFIEELLSLPEGSIDSYKVQPNLLLSAHDEARYPYLVETSGLNPEAMQIVCFFQSVVIAKCYPRWDEVIALIHDYFARNFPTQKLDFLIACGPDAQQPEGLKQSDVQDDYGNLLKGQTNARILVHTIDSLRDLAVIVKHATFVLSNDTGPAHISGALHIPTIVPYLPGNVYSKQVWASSLRHFGVTLDPDSFSFEETKAAVLWNKTHIIGSISPARIADEVMKACKLSHASHERA